MPVPFELVGKNGDKNGASNGFNSHAKAVVLLTFIAYIKNLSIPTQNLDVAIEHVDSTLQTIMCTKHLCSYPNIYDRV